MQKPQDRMREFALIGARARLRELEAEIADIQRDFPELAGAQPSPETTQQAQPPRQKSARPKRGRQGLAARKRPTMSPQARNAASERMRKYWENRRQSRASESDAEAPASSNTGVTVA
ncbi:MAG TPA: hypothetical protein VGQ10_13145 [Vicinamibacterales bacterium]|jgi:hypothetical protein|nr:hypothetical protein [Vicinamibacterales bacterium]